VSRYQKLARRKIQRRGCRDKSSSNPTSEVREKGINDTKEQRLYEEEQYLKEVTLFFYRGFCNSEWRQSPERIQ
jgi:hypothetical protein